MVIFDDGNAILSAFTFDQPTAWLATELKRDPDLWNRHWVIAQLGAAPTDVAAGPPSPRRRRVPITSSRASPPPTRSRLPCAVALPALQTAMKDTSAQVRAAALEALGHARRARPRHWRARPGTVTRATPCAPQRRRTGSVRFCRPPRRPVPGAAHAVLSRRPCRMRRMAPSPAGAIPRWWIRGCSRRRSALRAARAGGAGERGSTRALDLLVKHLDDERPYVRRWALEAFRFSLTRTLGTTQVAGHQRGVEVRRHQAGRR